MLRHTSSVAIYASELVKVQATWTPDPAAWAGEVAVNTFWLQHNHFTGNDWDWERDLQTVVNGCRDKFIAHWSATGGLFAAGYQISQFKAFHVDSAGHTLNEKVAAVTGGSLPGLGTSGVLPPEVSLVLSLYGYPAGTFTSQRGRKRGRIYLPYLAGSSLSNTGHVSTSAMDTCMTGFGAIFNDIQGMHAGNPIPPGNSSDYMALVVASGFGIATQVDHLAVDNLFDMQSRRQNKAVATKQTIAIAHS